MIIDLSNVESVIKKIVDETPIIDVHTHLYSPCFIKHRLFGIDAQLTYHYLIAETMRYDNVNPDTFYSMSLKEQADLVWNELFVKRTPVSEAAKGVLITLKAQGLDISSRSLDSYRSYYDKADYEELVDLIFQKANVKYCIMTNDPLDDDERAVWENSYIKDERFRGALRIDNILVNYTDNVEKLKSLGYDVNENLDSKSELELRRYIKEWADRFDAEYVAASLPPTFKIDGGTCSKIIENCVLPVCRELDLPFAMMIGVIRQINSALKLGGDAVGRADLSQVTYLCNKYPKNKFMLTVLSRENQHEANVISRKFRNLLPFGCWWFCNNPVIIEDITRMRIEMLGTGVVLQHSDCRVQDQLLNKWITSKAIISKIITEKYVQLIEAEWVPEEDEIRRDVALWLGGYYEEFKRSKL